VIAKRAPRSKNSKRKSPTDPSGTYINIHEVRRPDLDGQLAAENVALQLERRVAFRRAMKESVSRAMRMGAQGVRIQSAVVWAVLKLRARMVP